MTIDNINEIVISISNSDVHMMHTLVREIELTSLQLLKWNDLAGLSRSLKSERLWRETVLQLAYNSLVIGHLRFPVCLQVHSC